jgi:hypothetical protein
VVSLTRKLLTGEVTPKSNSVSRLQRENRTPGPRSNAPAESRGLAGNVERALEVAREAHDAQVMANLRELMKRPGPRILTRENVLALLRLLLAGLSPATDVPLGTVSTGQMLVTLHPSMALLDELIDALSDLKRGKTHKALKATSYCGTAVLSTKQHKQDKALLDTVIILKGKYGLKKRTEAEHLLAKKLRAGSHTRNGKPITAGRLKSLRDNWKSRKSIKD